MEKNSEKAVRRSVALPRKLVEEAQRTAPASLRGNFNQLVVVSLKFWIEMRKRQELENEIALMARDPGICNENANILLEFEQTELDGLL